MNSKRIKELKNFTDQEIFKYFYLKNNFLLLKEKFTSPKKRFEKKKIENKDYQEKI